MLLSFTRHCRRQQHNVSFSVTPASEPPRCSVATISPHSQDMFGPSSETSDTIDPNHRYDGAQLAGYSPPRQAQGCGQTHNQGASGNRRIAGCIVLCQPLELILSRGIYRDDTTIGLTNRIKCCIRSATDNPTHSDRAGHSQQTALQSSLITTQQSHRDGLRYPARRVPLAWRKGP